MKRIIFLLLLLTFSTAYLHAQVPQFAVVRPDGTTTICSSFDCAYNSAQNGDCIYLPGIIITSYNNTIDKELTIIGAGHYPDSTQATGVTSFNSYLSLTKKCYLEGFSCEYIVINNIAANESTFKRLRCNEFFYLNMGSNIIIDGCVGSVQGNCSDGPSSQNSFIRNSLIENYSLNNLKYTTFQNCIILHSNNGLNYYTNCNFYNCIFIGDHFLYLGGSLCQPMAVGNNYYNCIFTQSSLPFYDPNTSNSSGNFLGVSTNVFVNQSGYSFNYQHNYHLPNNSPYLTAGTDGTQIGIYGGAAPYIEGAVPSNPHIYFKQVADQTNSNGQLPVQFKVRTGN